MFTLQTKAGLTTEQKFGFPKYSLHNGQCCENDLENCKQKYPLTLEKAREEAILNLEGA